MLNVVDAVTTHRVCPCDCFATLPLADRIAGIRAVYKLDDALRGWDLGDDDDGAAHGVGPKSPNPELPSCTRGGPPSPLCCLNWSPCVSVVSVF